MDLVALAPRAFEQVLCEELGARLISRHDRLLIVRGKESVQWAQNLWLEPETFKFKSINEAAKKLRSIQRNWWLHSVSHHRRAKLIQGELPPLKNRRLRFPAVLPSAPLGAWTLVDENTMIFSAKCSSLFPDGEIEFEENKTDPPSRAYLKLWETFTLEAHSPQPGQRVVDLGSSPGGWTWVLDQLGCEVISVDKAPLSSETQFSPRVRFINESAFALKPEGIGPVDWFFSDIICYPEKLLQLVQSWSDVAKKMVCTIKFQGKTDHDVVREFLKIPNSRVRHLSCNKHELTWIRL